MLLSRFARAGRHVDLILLDLGLLISTFYASTLLRPMLRGLPGLVTLSSVNIPVMLYVLIPVLWIAALIAAGVYEKAYSTCNGLLRVIGGAVLATMVTAALVYFVNREFSRWLLILYSLLSLALLLGWRIGYVFLFPEKTKYSEDGSTFVLIGEGIGAKTRLALLNLRPPKTTIVVAILLSGALLRIYGIDQQSLWRDELQSWNQSSPEIRESLAGVTSFVTFSVHPPGHNVLLYLLIGEVGDSELALRFPSAMAGILAVAVMYALGRELYTHREGMLAAAFMAVLWMPIYFSQEARPYALMLFLSMLSMLLWVKTIRPLTRGRRPSLLLAIGYLVTAILASYSHYFGLLLIALEGLAAGLILLRRRELIYLPALYAPVAIAYVPWIRAVLYQAGRQSPAHLTADPALIRYFFWFIFNRSEGLGRAPTIVPEGLGLLFFVFLFAMLLVGAFRFYRSSDRRVNNLLESPTLLLLLWLLAPLISAYLISVQVNPVLINKNLIVVAPAAYLLLARAVMVLPLRQSLRYAIGASLVFVFLLHLLLSVGHYSRPQRPQIREAVQYVVDHYDQNEEALIVGYKIGLYRYYLPETFDERGIDHVISSGQIEYPKAIDRKLDERGTEYLWLLSGFEIGPPEQLLDNLGAKMALVDHVSLYEADVWLYRR